MPTHSTNHCFYLYPDKAPEWWDSSKKPTKKEKDNKGNNSTKKSGREDREDKIVAFSKSCERYSALKKAGNQAKEAKEDMDIDSDPSSTSNEEVEDFDEALDDNGNPLFSNGGEKYTVRKSVLNTIKKPLYTNAGIGDLVDRIREVKPSLLSIKSRSKYTANFVLDTGAEVHVISDKTLFRTYGGDKITNIA